MGSVCSCLHIEDFEEYTHANASVYRHCICLRCLAQQLIHAVCFNFNIFLNFLQILGFLHYFGNLESFLSRLSKKLALQSAYCLFFCPENLPIVTSFCPGLLAEFDRMTSRMTGCNFQTFKMKLVYNSYVYNLYGKSWFVLSSVFP